MTKQIKHNHTQLLPEFTQALLVQAEQLLLDGWDPRAIDGYVELVQDDALLSDASATIVLSDYWQEAHRVGSPLFTHMFLTGFHRSSATAAKRLKMLYTVLGLSVDENNFVQMTRLGESSKDGLYQLEISDVEDFANYVTFVDVVSRTIRMKYRSWRGIGRGKYATSQVLGDVLDNQFRYYLGKPVIDFIQCEGWTQVIYEETVLALTDRYVQYPDARLHNRGVVGQANMKVVTPDYHVEVIFNADGRPVSMWTALEAHDMVQPDGSIRFDSVAEHYSDEELQQLANTESVNYAAEGGTIHRNLDVAPANRHAGLEANLRNHAKNQFD
jgi:hypothetical protein